MSEGNPTKVDRNAETYGLDRLDDDLRDRRAAGASLRDLADFVNRRILERALSEADVEFHAEIEGLYRLLTADDVSVGRRAEVESKLEQNDVPITDVEADFVSHQTVRQHLNKRLDLDTSRESTLTPDDAMNRVDWAQSKSEGIIENTLEQLRNAGYLDSCDFDVSNMVRVTCAECGESFRLYEFMERGRCKCADDDGSRGTD